MMAPLPASESIQDALLTLISDATVRAGGILPFARFMELSLYAPELGYYERSSNAVGRHGDFYTGVSVGPLLGELLGFQFSRWLETMASPTADAPLHLVEAGAHDGRLAADILGWFRTWRPGMYRHLQLWLVEPSTRRRQWQQQTLADFAPTVHWASDLAELRARTGGVHGVLYSNELLDAFPVHRLAWSTARHAWEELGVSPVDGRWAWRPLPEGTRTEAAMDRERLSALPPELLAVLPDGFALEVSPAALDWWRRAAGTLREGFLMALDYGFDDDAVLRPEFPAGTLRGYRRHQVCRDVLSDPGDQDLTAHVDFSAIAAAGESAGLQTLIRAPQRRWLTQILEATLAAPSTAPAWDPPRIRQFQTLTHPEHLGRRFQVLVQFARRSEFPWTGPPDTSALAR